MMSGEIRMTKPRQDVLEVLTKVAKPMGAYDIIRAMVPNPKPPTVYRALEFLESQGIIHRIESLNAYVACHEAHHCCNHAHAAQFTICDGCGRVEEIAHSHTLPSGLQGKGFIPSRITTEIHGRCSDCA